MKIIIIFYLALLSFAQISSLQLQKNVLLKSNSYLKSTKKQNEAKANAESIAMAEAQNKAYTEKVKNNKKNIECLAEYSPKDGLFRFVNLEGKPLVHHDRNKLQDEAGKKTNKLEPKFVYWVDNDILCVSGYLLDDDILTLSNKMKGHSTGSHPALIESVRSRIGGHEMDSYFGKFTGGEMIFNQGKLESFNDQSGYIQGINFQYWLKFLSEKVSSFYKIDNDGEIHFDKGHAYKFRATYFDKGNKDKMEIKYNQEERKVDKNKVGSLMGMSRKDIDSFINEQAKIKKNNMPLTTGEKTVVAGVAVAAGVIIIGGLYWVISNASMYFSKKKLKRNELLNEN